MKPISYPEFEQPMYDLSYQVRELIAEKCRTIKSTAMPYKEQYLLEVLIENLKEHV